MMKITVLDSATLGGDISLEPIKLLGETAVYKNTGAEEVAERTADAEVIVVNKVKLSGENLEGAKRLKLICVTATGYDNIDLDYCRSRSIAVCNVSGYSTDSVAQLTLSMALSLYTKLGEFSDFVKSGEYSKSGVANRLTPAYREMSGKVWGIVGAGNIGKKVLACAEALGCRTIVYKKTPDAELNCVDIDVLCREADIISVHVPLCEETKNLISRERIGMMKKDAVFINVARGAVADEKALCDAIMEKRIGAIGIDVYSKEPFEEANPLYSVKDMPNVCLTPHMAWGAVEARERCVREVSLNIEAFYGGQNRSRVDII